MEAKIHITWQLKCELNFCIKCQTPMLQYYSIITSTGVSKPLQIKHTNQRTTFSQNVTNITKLTWQVHNMTIYYIYLDVLSLVANVQMRMRWGGWFLTSHDKPPDHWPGEMTYTMVQEWFKIQFCSDYDVKMHFKWFKNV